MYGIFTYIYHISPLKKQPNVSKYIIHGWYWNETTILEDLYAKLVMIAEAPHQGWERNIWGTPEIGGPLQQRYPTHLCLVVLHHPIEQNMFFHLDENILAAKQGVLWWYLQLSMFITTRRTSLKQWQKGKSPKLKTALWIFFQIRPKICTKVGRLTQDIWLMCLTCHGTCREMYRTWSIYHVNLNLPPQCQLPTPANN